MSFEIRSPQLIEGKLDGIRQRFHVPFEHLVVPGEQVADAFLWLKRHRPEQTPILIGPLSELDRVCRQMTDPDYNPVMARQRAEKFDLKNWLTLKENEVRAIAKEENFNWPERGPWPKTPQTQNAFQAHVNFSGTYYKQVFMALLPLKDHTLWAAELGFGGWNECPPPEVHIGLARHWHKLYGATIMSVGGDFIEYSVAQPVTSRKKALQLAYTQFLYCHDIVDQGFETLENLAASLIDATVWYFWWD